MYNHGKTILAERSANIRAYRQDRIFLRVAVVLLVVAFIGIGFCVAYGINISDAAIYQSIGQ